MEQEALEQIFVGSFDAYSDAIFRYCMVKVSNAELAEDMTQEVFTRYWQALRKGNEMSNTRSFLYTIANNLAKDWYKKKKADSLDARIEAGFEPVDTQGASAETYAAYTEILATIHDMDAKDKEVLLLRHVEGLDPKDIGTILDESANTVSVRIHRASKKLEERLHI